MRLSKHQFCETRFLPGPFNAWVKPCLQGPGWEWHVCRHEKHVVGYYPDGTPGYDTHRPVKWRGVRDNMDSAALAAAQADSVLTGLEFVGRLADVART